MTSTTPTSGSGLHVSKWTCPICDAENTAYVKPTQTIDQPIGALKNHILAQSDTAHGGLDQYPPDFDTDTLDEFVEPPRPFSTVTDA